MRASHRLSLTIATALLVLASPANPASAATRHAYGALRFDPGQLRSLAELPPGHLKRQVQALAPQAQANALRWLQKISISGSDLDSLRVDVGGGVFVVDDQALPAGAPTSGKGIAAEAAPTGDTVLASFAPSDAFLLHSKPGAANRVYLDFNGHSFSNTAWGAGTFTAVAFSTDADRSTFSDSERAIIAEIWHRVAEDYAPFDIDVTTEPSAITPATAVAMSAGRRSWATVITTTSASFPRANIPAPTSPRTTWRSSPTS